MVDRGCRFTYTVDGPDFYIVDNLNGNTTCFKNGRYTDVDITVDTLVTDIQSILEALNTSNVKTAWFQKIPIISSNDVLTVKCTGHESWTFGYKGQGAVFKDNLLTTTRHFDKVSIIRKLNFIYATILNMPTLLNPRQNTIRRFADVGIIVFIDKLDSCVVYEKNIEGNKLRNCMLNGKYYDELNFGISSRDGCFTLYSDHYDMIVQFPVDDSMQHYLSVLGGDNKNGNTT